MDYKCHIYDLPGVLNMRDIGGYAAKDGRITAKNRFIRSTALAYIDEQGEAELENMGVDCVIDLRSRHERKNAPDKIEQNERIHFAHVPMLDYISSNIADGDLSNFPKSMTEMYIGLLENGENDFKSVFELFADERFKYYLFHCTAGKDRTGVTTMLLLGLSGVDDEIIIEDYSYTESLIKSVIDTSSESLPRYIFESSPKTMRETLDYVRNKYGDIPGYLESIGVDRGKQDKILKKMF